MNGRLSYALAMVLLMIRAVWGTMLVLSPARLVGGSPDREHRRLMLGARLLGARHLIQAGLLVRHAGEPPPRWSISVDAMHGASMLVLAVPRSNLRSVALRSAAVASGFAASSFAARSAMRKG